MQPLLLRADASIQVGAGHVMRCLALAQAWEDAGGAAHFAAVELPAGLAERLAAEGMVLHRLDVVSGSREDSEQAVTLAQALGVGWVVEDGYHFGTDYQRVVKETGLRLLAIDDYGHAGHYVADLVLNQNIYADASLYPSREPYTQLLLGTQYVLLRREFRRWRGWQRKIPVVARKVLVTMGGGDPENVTARVIEALCTVDLTGLEVSVVAGGSNPHGAALQGQLQGRPGYRLLHHVSDMPELMAWADIAIAASGSTCWELAFMGLPSLLIVLADNQRGIAAGLAARGAAMDLGWHADLTPEAIAFAVAQLAVAPALRAELSARMQKLVDGEGAVRVLQAIQPTPGLTLRPASAADCRLVWEWANDPDTRTASFSSEPIPWAQHVAWFAAQLADPQHRLYIALDAAAQPVGQIRYEITGDEATVSIALAPGERRRGYGSTIIRQGTQQLFASTLARRIHAYIKPDNLASVRAFERAGFTHAGTTVIGQQTALHLVILKEGQP